MTPAHLCLAQVRFSPLPTWLTVPIAVIALVMVLWHMHAVLNAEMPASRKRIRLASGCVFMLLIPCSVAAFSLVTPAYERSFILVWIFETGLLFIVIMLAAADLFNTHRLRREHRENLRKEILAARVVLLEALDQRVQKAKQAARAVTQGAATPPASPPPPNPSASPDPRDAHSHHDQPGPRSPDGSAS